MSKKANTKRALLLSAMSLLLCMSMLIGSTFAWFTDTDTTAVSNVVSGTLDIEIVDADGKELKEGLTFVNKNGYSEIKWEPGATFQTQKFFVKNVGDLWLKYKMEINNKEVSYNKLNEVITWSVVKADGTKVDLATMGEVVLGPGATSPDQVLYIEGTMDTKAGNEYQGLTLTNLGITIYAKQHTKEIDMTGDQYDAQAEYGKSVFATTQDDLSKAVSEAPAGEATTVTLPAGDFTMPTTLTNKDITFSGTKDTVIDTTAAAANTTGANITFDGVTVKFDNAGHYKGFTHSDKVVYKNATIVGQQTLYAPAAEFINCTFNVDETGYNIWTYGATDVTFTDCTFNTGGRAILVYNEVTDGNFVANITMNNCTFNDDGTYTDAKAAVETGTNGGNTATSNKYNLTFNDCTISGFEQNNSTSALWGNKNSMDKAHLNVVINGVDVY